MTWLRRALGAPEGPAAQGSDVDALSDALYARGMGEPGVAAVLAFIEDPLPGWMVVPSGGAPSGEERD